MALATGVADGGARRSSPSAMDALGDKSPGLFECPGHRLLECRERTCCRQAALCCRSCIMRTLGQWINAYLHALEVL